MGFEHGRVEFAPPSDFVDESGGGKGRKWFKIAGIGCAVFVLIVGLITAAGVIKGISCCGDLKTVGENSIGAITYSMDFTSKIQNGRFEEARTMMAPELQAQYEVDTLEEKFSQPWLQGATLINEGPSQENMQLDDLDAVRNMKTWNTTMRLYPQEGSTQLVTTVGVKVDRPSEGETPATFNVYLLEVDERPIDFKTESPARAVLGFHGHLQAGEDARAYAMMNPQTQQGGMPTFKAFIGDQGELFTRSVMDIEDVRYPTAQSALVTARLATTSGDKGIVTYTLSARQGQPNWRIDGITPLITTDGDEPVLDPGEKIDGDAVPLDETKTPEQGEEEAAEGQDDAAE